MVPLKYFEVRWYEGTWYLFCYTYQRFLRSLSTQFQGSFNPTVSMIDLTTCRLAALTLIAEAIVNPPTIPPPTPMLPSTRDNSLRGIEYF